MSDTIFVQSISSTGGKPLVGTVLAANSGFLQWQMLADAAGARVANVRSYASGNPLLVALTDTTGTHYTTTSVAGIVSLTGQGTVTASVPGGLTITGSNGIRLAVDSFTGGGLLRVAVYSTTGTAAIGATVTGSVQATQAGSWFSFLQGSDGTRVAVDSFAGGGLLRVAVYSTTGTAAVGAVVTGSVFAAQVGSWFAFVQGSDGTRFAVDSFAGGGLLRVAVYSGAGGGAASSIVGSVQVTLYGSTSFVNTWCGVTSVAATIVPARSTRRSCLILNGTPVTVYVGAATVTTSVGFPLVPGASLELTHTAAIQAMTPQNSGFV